MKQNYEILVKKRRSKNDRLNIRNQNYGVWIYFMQGKRTPPKKSTFKKLGGKTWKIEAQYIKNLK